MPSFIDLLFKEKPPKNKVAIVSSLASLIVCVLWINHDQFYEPLFGIIVSTGILVTNCWITLPKNYASKRMMDRVSFDYSNNNGRFIIGNDDLKFETAWSKASGDSIHVYKDPASIEALALVKGVSAINLIDNAKSYDFSSRVRTPQEGNIVVFKNSYGNFAAIKIIDIKDNTRSDQIDELTFEYVINPKGQVDFR